MKSKARFTELAAQQQDALASRMVHEMRQRQELLELARGKKGQYQLVIVALIGFVLLLLLVAFIGANISRAAPVFAVFIFVVLAAQIGLINRRLDAMLQILATDSDHDTSEPQPNAEPSAARNGGPATSLGNSRVTEGPPSVS